MKVHDKREWIKDKQNNRYQQKWLKKFISK
jgi:tmRNA-binding protein